MADYAAIKEAMDTAIAEDGARAAWTDQQWADWFTEPVPVAKATALDVGGVYLALGADAIAVMAALRGGASLYEDILDMLRSPSGIDLSQPVAATLLAQLVGDGVLTQAQADTLAALAVGEAPRMLGVDPGHVASARGM